MAGVNITTNISAGGTVQTRVSQGVQVTAKVVSGAKGDKGDKGEDANLVGADKITVSDTEPSSPNIGDIWIDIS